MNLQSKFGYCITTQTLNIALCLKAWQNCGQTNGQTDNPITRCPRRTFQAGGIKKHYTAVDWVREQQIICWPWRWTVARGRRPRATVHLRGQQMICFPKTQTATVLLYPIFLNYVQWWTDMHQTKWSITQHKNAIHFFLFTFHEPFFKTKYECNSV